MTLIELLAACSLAALLIAAVSGVLGSLSLQQAQEVAQSPAEPWGARLVEQLQWDFANARHYQCAAKELTLVGFGGRDFVTHAVTFCRTEVRYQALDVGDRRWLVRRETHPDERRLDNFRAELACADVGSIEVESLDAAVGAGRRPPPAGAIPRKLRIRLERTDAALPAIEEVVHVF